MSFFSCCRRGQDRTIQDAEIAQMDPMGVATEEENGPTIGEAEGIDLGSRGDAVGDGPVEPQEGGRQQDKLVELYKLFRGVAVLQAQEQVEEEEPEFLKNINIFCEESQRGKFSPTDALEKSQLLLNDLEVQLRMSDCPYHFFRFGLLRIFRVVMPEARSRCLEILSESLNLQTLSYDCSDMQSKNLFVLEDDMSQVFLEFFKDVSISIEMKKQLAIIYADFLEHIWLAPLIGGSVFLKNRFLLSTLPRIEQHSALLISALPDDPDGVLLEARKQIEYTVKTLHLKIEGAHLEYLSDLRPRIGEPIFLWELGRFYLFVKRPSQAVRYLMEFSRLADEQEEIEWQIGSRSGLGSAYLSFGEFDASIHWSTRALETANTLKDPKAQKSAYNNLGEAHFMKGEFDKARKCQEKHLEIGEAQKNLQWIQVASCRLGKILRAQGELEQAIACYNRGIEGMEGNALHPIFVAELPKIATAFVEFGEIPKAMKIFEFSFALASQMGNYPLLATNLGGMGSCYMQMGEYQKALDFRKKQLLLASELNDEAIAGSTYGGLGNIYLSLCNYPMAVDCFNKQLELSNGNLESMQKAFIGLTLAYKHLEEYETAKGYVEKALKIASDCGDLRAEGIAYGNFGNIYSSMGDHERSITCYERCLEIAKEVGDRSLEGTNYGNLGVAYSSNGEHAKSIELHNYALIFAKERNDYPGIARTYFNIGFAYKELKDYENAIAFLEKALSQYTEIRGALSQEGDKITIFNEIAGVFHALECVNLEMGKQVEALEITDQRRALALSESLTDSKASVSKISEMQGYAKQSNSVLVIYSLVPVTAEKLEAIVWIVKPEGEVFSQQIPLDPILNGLEWLLEFVKAGALGRAQPKAPPSVRSIDELEELTRGRKNHAPAKARAFRKKLQNWHATFIAPITEHLPKGAKLTIVGDTFISQLPFAIFMNEEGKYLVEDHPISMAPSINVLRLLRERKAAREPAEGSLIVGNPEAGVKAPELPMAVTEAQSLKKILCTPDERVLMREEAKVSAVTRAMKGTKYLHLACHGELGIKTDGHSVFEGAFLLSPDESHEKGLLHAEDIGKLVLNADLAFLSACKSGKGAQTQEGTIGPMRSFLAAGANSVVGTLWSLPDSELTVEMVTGFYERVLGGTAKDEALREVMLMAIERKRNSPHAWGAFVLTGLVD